MEAEVKINQLNDLTKRQKVLIYFIDFNSFNYSLSARSINWISLDYEKKKFLIESGNWFRSKSDCEIAINSIKVNKVNKFNT